MPKTLDERIAELNHLWDNRDLDWDAVARALLHDALRVMVGKCARCRGSGYCDRVVTVVATTPQGATIGHSTPVFGVCPDCDDARRVLEATRP